MNKRWLRDLRTTTTRDTEDSSTPAESEPCRKARTQRKFRIAHARGALFLAFAMVMATLLVCGCSNNSNPEQKPNLTNEKVFEKIKLHLPEEYQDDGEKIEDGSKSSTYTIKDSKDVRSVYVCEITQSIPRQYSKTSLHQFYVDTIGSLKTNRSNVNVNSEPVENGRLNAIDWTYDTTSNGTVVHNRELMLLADDVFYRITFFWTGEEPANISEVWKSVEATNDSVTSISEVPSVSIGQALNTPSADITLSNAYWSDGQVRVLPVNGLYEEGVNQFTPADGSRIFVVEGTIKNTSGTRLNACNMYLKFKFNDKYEYENPSSKAVALVESIPDKEGPMLGINFIDPLASVSFYAVVNVPSDIVNDFKNGQLIIGTKKGWASTPLESELDDQYIFSIQKP